MIPIKVGDHLKEDLDAPPPRALPLAERGTSLCDNCFHVYPCCVAVAVRALAQPILISVCAFYVPMEETSDSDEVEPSSSDV